MIYVLGTAKHHGYDHLAGVIEPGLARGLVNNGVAAKVVWGGGSDRHDGIDYVPYSQRIAFAPNDVLLVGNPFLIPKLPQYPWFAEARHRWLFTSCDHPTRDFSRYNVILAENQRPLLQQKYPRARVFDFLMGCPEELPPLGTSPYAGNKVVLHCGRLGETPPKHNERLDLLRELAQHLPDHEFVVLSNTLTVPQAIATPATNGVVLYVYHGQDAGDWRECQWPGGPFVRISDVEMIPVLDRWFGLPNLHYWGARPWGTFWDMYRHAKCFVDFGFAAVCAGPNTKVVDPLRAGLRIVAVGCSSTFPLVQQHDGTVVPYQDVLSAAAAIRAMPDESPQIKVVRGDGYGRVHSWTAKIARVLAAGVLPS